MIEWPRRGVPLRLDGRVARARDGLRRRAAPALAALLRSDRRARRRALACSAWCWSARSWPTSSTRGRSASPASPATRACSSASACRPPPTRGPPASSACSRDRLRRDGRRDREPVGRACRTTSAPPRTRAARWRCCTSSPSCSSSSSTTSRCASRPRASRRRSRPWSPATRSSPSTSASSSAATSRSNRATSPLGKRSAQRAAGERRRGARLCRARYPLKLDRFLDQHHRDAVVDG